MTKFTKLSSKVNKRLVKEVMNKHRRNKQEYADINKRASEKTTKPGVKLLIEEKKSNVKPPRDPAPCEVTEI